MASAWCMQQLLDGTQDDMFNQSQQGWAIAEMHMSEWIGTDAAPHRQAQQYRDNHSSM